MKKLIIPFLFSLTLTSCITYSKYELRTNTVDYSKICDNNIFFLTESNSVSFEYKALGSISTECISGSVKATNVESTEGIQSMTDINIHKSASIEDAYKELIKKSIEKGANGVINLQSKYIGEINIGYYVYGSRWIVTGMMIRR
jgi:uncharacterized protein YbjQ (UPF0145 family)